MAMSERSGREWDGREESGKVGKRVVRPTPPPHTHAKSWEDCQKVGNKNLKKKHQGSGDVVRSDVVLATSCATS